MPGARSSSILASLVAGCTMVNPAFDTGDTVGDEIGDTEQGESSTEAATDDEASTDAESTSDAEATTDAESTSDTESTETGDACMPSQLDCDGLCVDPMTDPLFCGSCDMACEGGESCVEGSCVLDKLVFVSSQPHNGAYLDGINGVDDFCQDLADQALLSGTFYAWNSTSLSTPNLDFDESGRYVRFDGAVVADSYADLVSGNIQHPINQTELGDLALMPLQMSCPNVTDAVWTSTDAFGDFAEPNCSNWTTSGQLAKGRVGRMNATDATWSLVADCQMSCNSLLPVYCVQQTP